MASIAHFAHRGANAHDATPPALRRLRFWAPVAFAAMVLLPAVAFAAGGAEPAIARLHAQRMVAAAVAGAALATAGVLAQAVASNPLADPSILGTSGGAFLGAQCGLFVGTALAASVPVRAASAVVGALLGAGLALAAVLALTRRSRPLEFLLTGFLLATVLSGASTLVTALSQARPALGRALLLLSLGDLASAGWPELRVAVPLTVGAFAGALLRVRDLDLLALGADEAQALGLEIHRSRRALVGWAACATAAAVILGGPLAFVGLLAPHVARRAVGGAHGRLVPAAALVGAILVVLSDRAAASLTRLVSVPTGAITTLAGAPLFFFLLRARGAWASARGPSTPGAWRERGPATGT